MELRLDTPDVVTVKALSRIFPLAGVTTNPSIIAVGKEPSEVVPPQLHGAVGGRGRLFVQVMATTVEGMVNDAHRLRSVIADIVMKVPVTTEGLVTIKMLRAEGIPMLETAVYGAAQGLPSALTGAEYAASYVNRIDAQGDSGVQTATDLYQLLKIHTPQAKVLAASFRTPRQALSHLLAGGESITPPLDVTQQTISHPTIDAVMTKSKQD